MSGLDGYRRGSWGNWRGWTFLAVMLALFIGIQAAILPEHADAFMFSAVVWASLVGIGGIGGCRSRAWRWVDLLKGLR